MYLDKSSRREDVLTSQPREATLFHFPLYSLFLATLHLLPSQSITKIAASLCSGWVDDIREMKMTEWCSNASNRRAIKGRYAKWQALPWIEYQVGRPFFLPIPFHSLRSSLGTSHSLSEACNALTFIAIAYHSCPDKEEKMAREKYDGEEEFYGSEDNTETWCKNSITGESKKEGKI